MREDKRKEEKRKELKEECERVSILCPSGRHLG
jgi:hypothetical protein